MNERGPISEFESGSTPEGNRALGESFLLKQSVSRDRPRPSGLFSAPSQIAQAAHHGTLSMSFRSQGKGRLCGYDVRCSKITEE